MITLALKSNMWPIAYVHYELTTLAFKLSAWVRSHVRYGLFSLYSSCAYDLSQIMAQAKENDM